MTITITEAMDELRLDSADKAAWENILTPLIAAVYDYLEATTGSRWDIVTTSDNLAKRAGLTLIRHWMEPTKESQQAVDAMIASLQSIERSSL